MSGDPPGWSKVFQQRVSGESEGVYTLNTPIFIAPGTKRGICCKGDSNSSVKGDHLRFCMTFLFLNPGIFLCLGLLQGSAK